MRLIFVAETADVSRALVAKLRELADQTEAEIPKQEAAAVHMDMFVPLKLDLEKTVPDGKPPLEAWVLHVRGVA